MTVTTRSARMIPLSILAMAGAAVLPAAAVAQGTRLSARATPQILLPGQSAAVDVLARIPSTTYAVASAQFHVHASAPRWTGSTSGSVFGDDVLGAIYCQAHVPQAGIFADASNPLRVWRGVFTPDSAGPALVEVKPEPLAFSIYPSRLTSSWAPLDPVQIGVQPGLIFVNPALVGGWVAAPGAGTSISVSDDVVVDGRIITGPEPAPIIMGLLLPAVQKVRDAAVRVAFESAPQVLTAQVQAQRDGIPCESFSLNFTKATFDQSYEARAESSAGGPAWITAFRGGVRVAAGDVSGGGPLFALTSTPDVVETRIGPRVRVFGGRVLDAGFMWTVRFDQPVVIRFPGGPVLTADVVEIGGPGASSSNNLRQLGLGCHSFEAAGVQRMTLIPRQR